MAKKFFAKAKIDNSFIVSAETREALQQKINDIREKHEDYYKKFILPGYYVVEAKNIKESKSGKGSLSFDLPLFNASDFEYQVRTFPGASAQPQLLTKCPTLEEALGYFRDDTELEGDIVVSNIAGEIIKSYTLEKIREMIAEIDEEERRKNNGKQLRLF